MIRIRPEVSALLEARDVGGVRAALQVALELEFATIPPYLYAMWSLGPGNANSAVAKIIKSVVGEEMRHLATVANIINALGATPVFDSPGHIPHYPGPLPGAVEADLVVGLAPFSLDLVEKNFMVIEQPEHPLEFPVLAAAAAEPVTIGRFYRGIRDTIDGLGSSAFSGPPENQVTPDMVSGVVAVTDVATAEQAIDMIIGQGEGTATAPGEVVGTDFAHFYRFAEIVKGHKLIPNPAAAPSDPPDQQFTYAGTAIPVPPGILVAPVNPTTAGYPDGSAARQASIDFNLTYTSMLQAFQDAFSGHPDQISATVGTMFSLQSKATAMMTATPSAGPTFEWQEAT
jgi:ferritin-like protein